MSHAEAHIAETNAIVAELERAGLVTVTQRKDGAAELLDALLKAAG